MGWGSGGRFSREVSLSEVQLFRGGGEEIRKILDLPAGHRRRVKGKERDLERDDSFYRGWGPEGFLLSTKESDLCGCERGDEREGRESISSNTRWSTGLKEREF